MTDAECRQEIRDCIAFYDSRGSCWLFAVGFITFRYLFGTRARIISK